MAGETLPFAADGKVAREIVVTDSGASVGLAPGCKVGEWRIDGKIGEGGMGSVHAATHPVIGKRAAIKVVRAELVRSTGMAERFVQEARAVNHIDHPSVVDIFDIGQLPDGRPYLVMELLRGRTLGDRMEQGRMSPLEAIDVLLQVADALVAAHAHGVVHRDLKPDNIYLNEGAGSGSVAVKIVDWGIAKLRDDASPSSMSLTTSGVILGTPQYVSPEQARGKNLDERSDIYSLGVIAYEMFLEGPPFVAESVADMVAMHLREPPPPPSDVWPDIPAKLECLLLAMLAKSASDRPTLAEITETLRETRTTLSIRMSLPRDRLATGSIPPPTSVAQIAAIDQSRPTPLVVVPTGSGGYAVVNEPTRRPALRWALFAGGVALAAVCVVVVASVRSSKPTGAVPDTESREPASPVTNDSVAPSDAAGAVEIVAPAPTLGIEVRGAPAGARVWIDATEGVSRSGLVSGTVAPGRHVIRVEATGYEPYRREIDVRTATVLDLNLTKVSRSRRQKAAPVAEVRVEEPPKPTPAPQPKIDPNGTIEPF
jgi:serine/threonine-protein kinase